MFDAFKTPAMRKELRAHQVRALDLLRSSLGSGNRRVVMQGSTGFGKTLVAAKIIDGALAKGRKVLFTTPAINLVDQSVEAFEAEGVDWLGVMQANHVRTDWQAPVQVATLQTLQRRDVPDVGLVIVDECHVMGSQVAKLMQALPRAHFVGLSATPWAQGMGRIWQDLVVPVTISELIDAGHLSRFTAYAPDVPDLRGVKVSRGDYVERALADVMGEAKLLGNVVETWLAEGENRPTLCFAVNRAHAAQLAEAFSRAGVSTAYVDGKTDRVERDMIGRQFRDGDVRVICSVRTMTTGVDLPISCIIDAAPTQSEMLHVQKIGRGLRVNPGTEDCKILDHAGNSLRLGLVTDIHHADLDDSEPGDKRRPAGLPERLPKACPSCSTLVTTRLCPFCGHEKALPKIDHADGELVEITGRVKQATKEDKQRFYSMALWLDDQRQRGGKLALGLYKGKFGVWPRSLSEHRLPADAAFLSYEKSRRIAYAKRRAAEVAA